MRHKQRPVKSSRHKSVTFIIDSHTSFGDHNNDSHNQSSTQQLNINQQHHKTRQPVLPTNSQRPQRSTSYGGSATSYDQQPSTGSNKPTPGSYRPQRAIVVATNDDQPKPLMRKQFEHNFRHMSDVMRLAFLENNDISIDDCSNIDFNSLSTASILQRNIQQQLQQERRDQLQLRQQHQQQQQQQQQQQLQQQQFHHQALNRNQIYEQELTDDYDIDGEYDYISDSRIFATATPTSSSSSLLLNRASLGSSTPKIAPQQPSSSSGQRLTSSNSGSNIKKRTRESIPRVEFSNHVQVETIQNYGEGFLCDEPGCGKSFPSLRKLRHHKVVHSDEFPFVCEFRDCAKKFKRKFGIDLHSTTHFDLDPAMYSKTSNNSSLPFFGRRMQYSMCKPCGQKFKTVHEYQYHMLKHGKEPFKCPVKGCGQTFGIWKSFQKHRASHYFNYYCKMDPRCDHHTSNLQLLKLHIYCCHFRRKLPENATLSSKDPTVDEPDRDEPDRDEPDRDESIDVVHSDRSPQIKEEDEEEESITVTDSSKELALQTPRRDSRLRKNPPRSSTFGHQDYASINNGSSFVKSLPTTPTTKRTRAAGSSQSLGGQSGTPPEKKVKLPLKILPKRSAQRLPMSLIADDASTADEQHSSEENSNHYGHKEEDDKEENDKGEEEGEQDSLKPNYGEGFLCDEPGCGKSFPSLRKLRHHKVVHSDEFPFVCEFRDCAKKFKRKFGIDLHSTTHFDLDPAMYSKTSNNSSLPFFGRRMQYSMCKPCGQKFKTVHEYQYHMLKHGKEPFKCPVKGCGQTFGIWKSFQKHRASHYFNYYCKMDPRCDHHTSNLQLLKLHIYCCHFRRKLPENATLSSKDPTVDEPDRDESIDVVHSDRSPQIKEEDEEEESITVTDSSKELALQTPRRDSRLRKNPPRSSTFGHQDYASINNGSSFVKSLPTTPTTKRTRAAGSSQSLGGQSGTPPEKKVKLPLKILPKRSAQRLPMSLIADDASTEDEQHSSEENSMHDDDKEGDDKEENDKEEEEGEQDPTKRNRFRCNYCDYHFSVRFQLTKHLSTHLDLTPDMYSKTADKQVVKLSELRRREFQCDKCKIKYEQMSDLDEHMQKKHGQRPYVCHFCQVPSTFSMAKQYLSHLYEHRFIYRCTMEPDCDFTINRKDALKLHIFRMHLNQQLPAYLEELAHIFAKPNLEFV